MTALRILHVIPAIAPRYGGPSRAVFEMCRAVREQGAEVLLATTDADGAGRLPVELGMSTNYKGTQTIFFTRQLSQTFGYSRPLARWLNSEVGNFDAVHIHAVFSHPCVAAARACRRWGVPYIVRPLGSLDPWSIKQKRWRKRVMWQLAVGRMLREAAAIHYTTEEEKQLAESRLRLSNGVVIPLGLEMQQDGEAHFANSHAGRLPNSKPYVLALSRLHPKKNLELLIESFLSLGKQPEFKDWYLLVAGDGEAEYVAGLKRLSSTLGGEGRVIFTGWLDGEEREAVIREAALLALPSHQENFGLCVVEAMLHGVPVLVSDKVNLASEIRKAGAGWVTPLNRAEVEFALREALRDGDERARRGRAGRLLAVREFASDRVAHRLISLYLSIRAAKASDLSAIETKAEA